MGEEHRMLYYRPPMQSGESYNEQNIFYQPPNLARKLEHYRAYCSKDRVADYNQTNAKAANFISEKNANQRLVVPGFSKSIVEANPNWTQHQSTGRSFRNGKPFKTSLPAPPSLESQFLSAQPECLVQMCSGFGHQDCLFGQDNFADFDIIEKGWEEEMKNDDLLSTPPMWRKSKDWQKLTRGRVENVRVSLKLESEARKRVAADMEETEESRNEMLMEERVEEMMEDTMEEMMEDTMEEMDLKRGGEKEYVG